MKKNKKMQKLTKVACKHVPVTHCSRSMGPKEQCNTDSKSYHNKFQAHECTYRQSTAIYCP